MRWCPFTFFAEASKFIVKEVYNFAEEGNQEADCTHSRFGDFSFFFKSSGRFCQMHVVIAFRGLFVCFLCKRNTTYIHIAIYVGICVCVWTAISCPGRWGAKRSQVFFALCHAGRPPLFVEFIFDSEND